MEFSWNNFSLQNASIDLEDTPLSPSYASFIPLASRVPLLSGATSKMTPEINAYAQSSAASDVFIHWQSEAELENTLATDLLSGPHPDDAKLNNWSEPYLELETVFSTGSPPAQTSANVILRQAVFSPWHERSIATAEAIEHIDYLTR
jgi:hypothetical protein